MFPTLSVTLIGLAVGAIAIISKRQKWNSLLFGVVGAWIGFALGALLGVAIDALFATGVWVAYVGHALAAVGALIAVRRASLSPARSGSTR